MEYPSGHHSHTHHHRRRDDDDQDDGVYPRYPPPNSGPPPPPFFQDQNEFPPPPPPSYFQDPPYFPSNEYAPPPPAIHQTHGYPNQGFDAPGDYPPPPPPVTHISHQQTETQQHHSYRPHMPSFVQHMTHHSDSAPAPDFSSKPTFKVYCKAEPNFRLTIRQGTVVLAPDDPSDEFQNWYKDEKYSTRVKDEEGCPCFALVNKASGQAVKHSIGASHPVELISYNPDVLDQSILWTESKDLGDAYRAVRMVNNVRLNLDAFHGDEKSGGVRDGTTIVLWQWNKGNNQRWRITPHCKFQNPQNITV
ncbi:Ricin B-like lectin EULS3 [Euphorbia peplus]|nr:Ricin B-like lectin EULS3 [Euphorbia peplus]